MMLNGKESRIDLRGNPMRKHVRWLFMALFGSLIVIATLIAVSEESEGIGISMVYRDPSIVDLEGGGRGSAEEKQNAEVEGQPPGIWDRELNEEIPLETGSGKNKESEGEEMKGTIEGNEKGE